MSEKNHNNLPVGEGRQSDKVDDDFIPDDAWPVCPKCLMPCHPLEYYCSNCNSNEAINPLASYMPYVRIRLNIGMLYKLWRRFLYDKDISIVLRVMFLLIFIYGLLLLPG